MCAYLRPSVHACVRVHARDHVRGSWQRARVWMVIGEHVVSVFISPRQIAFVMHYHGTLESFSPAFREQLICRSRVGANDIVAVSER